MSFRLSERAPPGAVPFNEKRIAPHIPVIDKSKRDDGTFSREDFTFDKVRDLYIYPAGEILTTTGTVSTDHAMRYIAPVPDRQRTRAPQRTKRILVI
jgi:hypothetical protein